jgi:4-amino-4-deoxy-L-arabinose transferase-like glycosyltransferase
MVLGSVAGLLAFAALSYYAYEVQPLPPGEPYNYLHLVAQLRYVVWGGLFMALAVLLSYPQSVISWARTDAPLSRRVNLVAGLLGAGCMVAFTEAQTQVLGIEAAQTLLPDEQFALLVAAAVLIIYGLGGGGRPWRALHVLRRMPRRDFVEIGAVLAITVLAFGVRVWDLGTAVHAFVDELNFATVSTTFWVERYVPLTLPGVRNFPFIFPYLQNHFVTLLGRDLDGLRMLSVVMGTLTVPGVYLLGRALFDRPTALAGAVFLATFPPHIQFSRLGLNNIADPLFGTFALAFLARGFKHNRRVDFVAAGVMLGLTQYWYELGRTLFPLLVVVWCAWGLVTGYAWGRLRGLFLAALAAAIFAGPIYATLYVNDLPLNPRVQEVGNTDTAFDLLENVENSEAYHQKLMMAYMMFIHQQEWGTFYYGGEGGFVLAALVPLVLLGGAYTLVRVTTPGVVLVGMVALNGFFTSLIFSTQLSARYVVSFPVLALLMGVGLRVLVGFLLTIHFAQRWRLVLLAVVLLVSGVGGLLQTRYYYETHLPIFNRQFRANHDFDAQDAVFRLRDFPPPTQGHIIAANVPDLGFLNGVLNFLRENPHSNGVQVHDPASFQPWELDDSRPRVFFLPPGEAEMRYLINWYFLLAPPQTTPYNVPQGYDLVLYPSQGRVQTAHPPAGVLAAVTSRAYFALPPHLRWSACLRANPQERPPLHGCFGLWE